MLDGWADTFWRMFAEYMQLVGQGHQFKLKLFSQEVFLSQFVFSMIGFCIYSAIWEQLFEVEA
jgi:hypothetical protein